MTTATDGTKVNAGVRLEGWGEITEGRYRRLIPAVEFDEAVQEAVLSGFGSTATTALVWIY
jgi:hypothetical protein